MTSEFKVLVTGDREWSDYQLVFTTLLGLRGEIERRGAYPVLVHGAARGADTIAHAAAYRLGYEIRRYPAQWELYGRSAGPRRNQEMLNVEVPHLVIAFHDDLENSKGTKDMVERARKAGIEVRHYESVLAV